MNKHFSCLPLIGLMLFSCQKSVRVDLDQAAIDACDCITKVQNPVNDDLDNCLDEDFSAMTDGIGDDDLLDSLAIQMIKKVSRTCETIASKGLGNEANTSFRVVSKDKAPLISTKACQTLSQNLHLYYVEAWGDTTWVKTSADTWMETFPDSTFSHLKFRWTDGCAFENEFVESNHFIKKDLSQRGEIYKYKVIDHDTLSRQYIVYAYSGNFIVEVILRY